jgi:hypothetical protein
MSREVVETSGADCIAVEEEGRKSTRVTAAWLADQLQSIELRNIASSLHNQGAGICDAAETQKETCAVICLEYRDIDPEAAAWFKLVRESGCHLDEASTKRPHSI